MLSMQNVLRQSGWSVSMRHGVGSMDMAWMTGCSVASQVEGLSDDCWQKAQQAVGTQIDVANGTASAVIRRLAEESDEAAAKELEALAQNYDAAAQVKRFWELFRSLFYSGAPATTVAAVLPDPNSVLCFSLSPADVLIAVHVLCLCERVADACAWVRKTRSSGLLSRNAASQMSAQAAEGQDVFGAGEDLNHLLGIMGMGLICSWCWAEPEGRTRRLGMLVRVLQPHDDSSKAIQGQLSWEETQVVNGCVL